MRGPNGKKPKFDLISKAAEEDDPLKIGSIETTTAVSAEVEETTGEW